MMIYHGVAQSVAVSIGICRAADNERMNVPRINPKPNQCKDCGKAVGPTSIRCPSCARIGELNPCAGLTRENHPSWRGGRRIDRQGYVRVRIPDHPYADSNGYVREHRLVMEASLGRLLDFTEIVHHINGDKNDNRLENLELVVGNGEHVKLHRAHQFWHSGRGQEIASSKLSASQVIEIRRRYALRSETKRAIANIFGVSECCIYQIIKGNNWAWLPV